MVTLTRVCLLSAALCALAGGAAAQASPGQIAAQAGMQNISPEPGPGSFIDQPPPAPRRCQETQAKDAPAPKVIKTMPAPGSVVRPGAMVLSVTFDRPMSCKANIANGSPFPIPCPSDKSAVVIAQDQRTLTTVCQVEAGASYTMPITDFVSARGGRSQPYDLTFTTSTETPVTDVHQALFMEKSGPIRR